MIEKMKKLSFGLVLFVLMSCAGGASANGNSGTAIAAGMAETAGIADIQDRDWVLAELRSSSGTVQIDRTRPGAAEVYTLRFESERLSGMGAPNRYFAPYTGGTSKDLSIGMVASTLMAALFENQDLREQDYFAYLGKVSRWDLRDGNLELYTSAENGSDVVLIFR